MKKFFKLFLSYVVIINFSVNVFAETTNTNIVSSKLELQLINNSITPKNMYDPSIIYIKESMVDNQKHVSFIFCKDRNEQSNCIFLGGRSFSVAKLEEFSTQLKMEQDQLLKKAQVLRNAKEEKKRDSKTAKNTFIGVWYATSVIILTMASGTFAGSLFVGLLALVPGLFVAQNINFDKMVGLTYAEAEYNYILRKTYNDSHYANMVIRNPNKSYPDLSKLAQSLHEFLNNFENQTGEHKILNP